MNQQKNYISRLSKSLLMMILAVNFIYAGVFSEQQMEMENCCHNIVEEISCCMVEPEMISMPSCKIEIQNTFESMSDCGCIHEFSMADHSFLTKSNIDFSKITIELDFEIPLSVSDNTQTFPFVTKTEYNYKIPIYISVSSYLI